MRVPRTVRNRRPVAFLAALAVGLTASFIALGPASASTRITTGGTVSIADSQLYTPNYVFPLIPAADEVLENYLWFEPLLYEPLYTFGGNGHLGLNKTLSLADPPVFTQGGRVVTVTLKDTFHWTDGQPVTARDVLLCYNLLKDNYAQYAYNYPGGFPSNVQKFDVLSSSTFQITFDKAYNELYTLENQLAQVYALPQYAWDKTSTTGAIGNYDESVAGSEAVWNFLTSQSTALSTYATNPLWKVVDGRWKISAYVPLTGYLALSANPDYTGPDKPHIKKLIEEPFTSEASEFDALKSGSLDYGFLPFDDLKQAASFKSSGYDVVPWDWYDIYFIELNFTNPGSKAYMKQLYVRQALQHLINEPQYIKDVLDGYGTQTYGPVPNNLPGISSSLAPAIEKTDPYPFSVSTATDLLRTHGWTIHPHGVDTCARPGTGPTDCGAGVARGTRLTLRFLLPSGVTTMLEEAEAIKSAASTAGISITLLPKPGDTLFDFNGECPASSCNWEMTYYVGGWDYGPPAGSYPTGGPIWSLGDYWAGGFSTPKLQQLISETETQSGTTSLDVYVKYMRTELPVLWMPIPPLQFSVIRSSLKGVYPQGAYGEINPQNWYWEKK